MSLIPPTGVATLALALVTRLSATEAPLVVVMPGNAERKSCPYHSHAGCFLDTVSQACAEDGHLFRDLIDPDNQEQSVWMCCCDEWPHDPEWCSEAVGFEACSASLGEHVAPLAAKGEAATKAEVVVALQRARGALLRSEGDSCTALFEEEPHAVCGVAAEPPVDRTISRADLFCEFLTFQSEAHGVNDAAVFRKNGCPMDAKVERHQCEHYQHMGCLLDIFGRSCNDDEDEVHDLVDPRSEESVWLCCCKQPYASCSRAEGSSTCNAALMSHVGPLVKKGKKVTREEVVAAVQKARGALRIKGGARCAVLAEAEPQTTCGSLAEPPVEASIARGDLQCELMTWQWEELGDGEPEEFERSGCPFDPGARGLAGESRMGGVLLRPERHNYEL